MNLFDDSALAGPSRPEFEQCRIGCVGTVPVLDRRDPIRIRDAELTGHHPMERCYYRCTRCGHAWVAHHFTHYLNEHYPNDATQELDAGVAAG